MSDDYPSNSTTTGLVGIGSFSTGMIEVAGDTDWFGVSLIAGHSYQFDLMGNPSGHGTLVDPALTLFDGSSTQLAYNDDIGGGNWDSRISYTPTSSGTYYLSAASRGGPGTYRIAATQTDDAGSTPSTSVALGVGSGPLWGNIEVTGDTDWYAVTLTAGSTYQFDLQGNPSGNGMLADPALTLLDGSGSQIAYNDDIGGGNWDSRIAFTATSSGTYYLSAASRGGPGTYRVVATKTDDYGSTPSTAGALSVGSLATGNIETSGDTDWFAVTLTAGHTYQFDLQGNPSGHGTLVDPCMWLLDSGGNQIAYNDDLGSGDWDSRITYTPTSNGTFYLAAGSRGGPGTYRMVATDVTAAPDDYAGSIFTTGVVNVGGSVTGTIETTGDSDWFAVTLVAGHNYRFDAQGASSGNGTLTDPYLALRDSSGNILASNNDISIGTTDASVSYSATSSGKYFLSVRSGTNGGNWGTGTYLVSAVEAAAPDDYASSPSTTGQVSISSPATGAIEVAGDTDWFAVTLSAGSTYQFDIQGSSTGNGTLVDPYAWLMDSAGNQINSTYSDDVSSSDWDSRITYTAPSSGTYYVSVGSRGGPGTYRVSMSNLTPDDYAASTATTGVLIPAISHTGGYSFATAVSGSIEVPGDSDWFRVDLLAGHHYWFYGSGVASVSLMDSAGNNIPASPGTAAWDPQYTPTCSGTYYLSASNGSSNGTGTYRIAATDLVETDDYPFSLGTLGTIPVGGAVTGTIETRDDADMFKVTLTAGRTYQINLQGQSSGQGTAHDPLLFLLDSSGNEIAVSDDASWATLDSQITYTPTTTAAYYLEARTTNSSDMGTYRLAVTDSTTGAHDTAPALPGATDYTIGATVDGDIATATSSDFYQVTLQAGATYQFNVYGNASGGSMLADAFVAVYDAGGNVMVSKNGPDPNLIWTATSSDTYYLQVCSTTNVFSFPPPNLNLTGGYELSSAQVDDYGASTTTAGALSLGTPTIAKIDAAGDTDWFAVTVAAGHSYQFEADAYGGVGALQDPFLELRDSSGTVITYNDDAVGKNSVINWTAPSSGTYYLSVHAAQDSLVNDYGQYSVLASETTTDTYTSDSSTTGAVRIGGSAVGNIEVPHGTDWLSVSLVSGHTYQFDLQGNPSGNGTLVDPALWLLDGSGNQIAYDDDISGSNWDSRITYTAASSGTYFLDAGSRGGPGTYQVLASEVLPVGSSMSGNIQTTGETDSFAVTLLAGQAYHFDLQGNPSGHGTLGDPCLWLRDSSGAQLAYNDDTSGSNWDSHIVFTPSSSGTYFLDAGGRGVTGSYLLSAATGP